MGVKKAKKYLFVLSLAIVFLVVLTPISGVHAQDFGTGFLADSDLPTDDVRFVIIRIINYLLGALGIVFLGLVLYGGFLWMTAGGDGSKVDKAKKVLINAITGLLIVFLSFAITRFVFNILKSASTPDVSDNCQEGDVSGCSVCTGGRWAFSPSLCPLPGSSFSIKDISTANGSGDPAQDVYLCSSIQTQFNNKINKNTVGGNITLLESGQDVSTSLYTGSRVVEVDPQSNLKPNTSYTVRYSKDILDTTGIGLSACYPFSCTDEGTDFVWGFVTGTSIDSSAPAVQETYPTSDKNSPKYPMRNAPRDVLVKVKFTEAVRSLTIEDGTGNPIPSNITVQEIDGQNGNVVTTLSPDMFEVFTDNDGFTLRIIPPDLYEPFTWYRVTVQNVEDLCGNPMQEPYVFEFQTNDRVPGIGSYYPQGDNNCPNTEAISFSFKTSMYYDFVSITVSKDSPSNPPVFSAGIRPSDMDPGPYQTTGDGGVFYTDSDSDFKAFSFEPFDTLEPNTTYYVSVNTDRTVDVDGNTIQHSWEFSVSTQETCSCSPYISSINPSDGLLGQCVTVKGYCFKGAVPDDSTDPRNAQVTSLDFNGVPAVIGSYDTNYITSSIPLAFTEGDYLFPQVAITYNDSNYGTLSTNNTTVDYYVSSSEESTGPCLLSVSPSKSCYQDDVDLEGLRFGSDPGIGNRSTDLYNVEFSDNNSRVVDDEVYLWKPDKISVKVPQGAFDGGVTVTSDGQISNSVPFDISCSIGQSCNANSQIGSCVDGGICGEGLVCDPNASCTCQYSVPPGTPRMIYDPNCESSTQSPSPYSNTTGVCVNSLVSARFDMDMDETTFNMDNIKIFNCANSEIFSKDNCSSETVPGLYSVIVQNDGSEGFIFTPFSDYEPSTWYRVEVNEGVRSADGVNLHKKYSWIFKTKDSADKCEIDSVRVSPSNPFIYGLNKTRDLFAIPQADGCQILNPSSFSWIWTSEDSSVAVVDNTAKPTTTVTSVGVGISTTTAETLGIKGYSFVTVEESEDPTLCSTDADCITGDYACPGSVCNTDLGRCTPVIDTVTPDNGAPGNFVTISGCMFGNLAGSVDFLGDINNNEDDKQAILPVNICSRVWTNNQVIVEIPDVTTTDTEDDAVDGPIQLQTYYGLKDVTDSSFDVNDNIYPGICQINPERGVVEQQVTLSGNNFGDTKTSGNSVEFESVIYSPSLAYGNIVADEVVKWTNNSAVIKVPVKRDESGNVLEKAYSGDVYVNVLDKKSNPVYFDMNPYIEKITPAYGPEGKFITIIGGNFGYKPGRVIFKGDKSICQGGDKNGQICSSNVDCLGEQTNGVCVNDSSDDLEAVLPTDICGDVWSDTVIIAKVPQGAKTGLVKVETSSDYTPDGSLTTLDKDSGVFVVDNTYPMGANLCRVVPSTGRQGDSFSVKGENMGENKGTSKFIFSVGDNKQEPVIDLWSDNSIESVVPFFDNFTSTTTAFINIEKEVVVNKKCTGVFIGGKCIGGVFEDVKAYISSNYLPYYIKPGLGAGFELNVKSINPLDGDTNVCRNIVVDVDFDKIVDRTSVTKDNIYIQYRKNYQVNDSIPSECVAESVAQGYSKSNTGIVKSFISKISEFVLGVFAQTGETKSYVCKVPSSYVITDNKLLCDIKSECVQDNGCDCFSDYPVNENKVCTVKKGEQICYGDEIDSTVSIVPDNSLDSEIIYSVYIKGGENGVRSIDRGLMADDYISEFTTKKELCSISDVDINIDPPGIIANYDLFNCALPNGCIDDKRPNISGNQHIWTSLAKDAEGNSLQADYSWDVLGSLDVLSISPNNSPQVSATPQGLNGQVLSRVIAKDDTNPDVGVAVGFVNTDVFICNNPWPSVNSFPFVDNNMDFSFYYCRDKGENTVCMENGKSTGKSCTLDSDCQANQVCELNTKDDLPELSITSKTNPVPSDPNLLKEYLFLPINYTGSGAIALRVYANDGYLNILDWYKENVPNPGKPKSILIDNYPALQEGRTVYVSGAVDVGGGYRNYVYILSYSKNAEDEIIDIYNQLIDNWKLTIGVVDKNVCSGDSTVFCNTDSECKSVNAGKCILDYQKIRRDLSRVQDISTIKSLLNEYYNKNEDYPDLKKGTYKVGFTTSKWPSWQQQLGSQLGRTLPVDPLNKFSDCPLGYSQDTCWNEDTKDFVCNPDSYIYQYQYGACNGCSSLYSNFELDDINWVGFGYSGNTDMCNSVSVNLQNGN